MVLDAVGTSIVEGLLTPEIHPLAERRKPPPHKASPRPRSVGRPSRADAERRKRRLLDTAADIFIRRGYAGASIDRIAAAAGVGKPTIYARFGSKANLLKAVIEYMLENRIVAIDDRISAQTAEDGLKEQLANIIAASVEPVYLGIFRLFLTEARQFPGIFDAFEKTMETQSQSLLIAHMQAHREFDRLKVSHTEAAKTLLWMAGTIIMMASAQPGYRDGLSPIAEASRIVDVALHGMLEPR